MLQYRLSTLFLLFFFVAATMALFRAWGIWITGILFLAALILNRAERMKDGIVLGSLLIFFALGPVSLLPVILDAGEAARRANCGNNQKELGFALHIYYEAKGCFPSVFTCNKDDKPLFSWVVQVLPHFEYDPIYNALKQDEPWNSPHNMQVLDQSPVYEFQCPSANHRSNGLTTDYAAIVGRGTIWRNKGTIKLSDLPDAGSHTVALVEVADSGKHWAEPFALTVDEVLANMKSGKGVRISSYHPAGVCVVFADDSIRRFPSKMSLSLWRKILDGEVPTKHLENINLLIDPNAPDMVDVYVGTPGSKPWSIILGVIVWLLSVVLLFHRAVKSRKIPELEIAAQPTPSTS